MTPVSELAKRWRDDAEVMRRRGAIQGAELLTGCADELQESLRVAGSETLDLAQAAAESGYSPDRLRHLVSDGTIPNAGKRGAPLIRRADLPRKPARKAERFDAGRAARRMLSRAAGK